MFNFTLLIFTDGRWKCLAETIESAREKLFHNGFKYKMIINDSLDTTYADLLDIEYGEEFEIHHTDTKRGFGGTINRGWRLLHADTDYVFHLEDDFTFNEEVNLHAMADVLEENEHLGQIVLKRQPWNPQEKKAGGIVECWPDLYEEKSDGYHSWTEHTLFWSTNPGLYHQGITIYGWPEGERSEEQFTKLRVADGLKFAFWGGKLDPPKVHHIGDERVGTGY